MRRLTMVSSAIVMGLLGAVCTFGPDELLRYAGQPAGVAQLLAVQLLGALYLSFAMLNWMAKESLIGGIYNRPIALANILHFFMGALALTRHLAGAAGPMLIALVAIYWVFSLAFARILFTSPVKGIPPDS